MASVTRNPRPLFVTTLPAGYDGQEVFYQSTTAGTGGGSTDTMATVGAVWHLRYRAAGGTYKWEFVGGSASGQDISTAQTKAVAGAFTDLATVGPLITVPLAGDYDVTYGAQVSGDNADRNTGFNLNKNGTQLEFAYAHASYSATDGATGSTATAIGRYTLAASDVLKIQYYSAISIAPSFSYRRIRLVPIRVG